MWNRLARVTHEALVTLGWAMIYSGCRTTLSRLSNTMRMKLRDLWKSKKPPIHFLAKEDSLKVLNRARNLFMRRRWIITTMILLTLIFVHWIGDYFIFQYANINIYGFTASGLYWTVGILVIPIVFTAIIDALAASEIKRELRRRKLCTHCGYNIRSRVAQCPECGYRM